MDNADKLTEIFRTFPGIGPRQAKRFVYFLLTRNKAYIQELTGLIQNLQKDVLICPDCFRYFAKGRSEETVCDICRGKNRETDSLMIVARDIDLENIEKSHSFNGRYFVLGGTVPILEKEPEKKVRLNELVAAVKKKTEAGLREVILGFSLNPESEYTADLVIQALKPLTAEHGLKISRLGRGLSTGTELEYSDVDTIKNALKNRS